MASVAGASASLVVSAPLDVIKTRVQNRNFENPESGFRIISSMLRNEGLSSFFKGLTPKVSEKDAKETPTHGLLFSYPGLSPPSPPQDSSRLFSTMFFFLRRWALLT